VGFSEGATMRDSGGKKNYQKPSHILYVIWTLRHNKLYVKKKISF